MNTYNTAPPADELTRAQTELNQVKDIMVQNVEQILSRGERIELLVDKTDVMAGQATAFRRGARTVRRQMWWKNKKILALCVAVGLVSSSRSLCDLNGVILKFYLGFPMDSFGSSMRCWTQSMWILEDIVLSLGIFFTISSAFRRILDIAPLSLFVPPPRCIPHFFYFMFSAKHMTPCNRLQILKYRCMYLNLLELGWKYTLSETEDGSSQSVEAKHSQS